MYKIITNRYHSHTSNSYWNLLRLMKVCIFVDETDVRSTGSASLWFDTVIL